MRAVRGICVDEIEAGNTEHVCTVVPFPYLIIFTENFHEYNLIQKYEVSSRLSYNVSNTKSIELPSWAHVPPLIL